MARFLVRTRAWGRPTRVYNRAGQQQGITWWPWQTVARFDTYAAAWADVEARERAREPGIPTQAAVFYRGKPYRLWVNAQGEILQVDHGAAALRRIFKPR